MKPSHSGILYLILEAKKQNNLWADAALAEIGNILNIHYVFERRFISNKIIYEIGILK